MEVDNAEDGEPSPKRKRTSAIVKHRPNFFVAVQISNPEIHRKVSALQKIITTKKPLFKSTLIKLVTLHITLCTLHLPRNGDIRRAKSALRMLETNMKEVLVKDPISLKFKGIGSFKNEVVFAKIEPGEPLTRIKDLHINLIQALKDEGLIVTDKFEPHLTVMKMSKDWRLRKKKIFKIPKNLYEEHNEMLFGDQMVSGLQLLKMGYRPLHQYYNCYHNFDLGIGSDEIEDHEDCCGVKSVFPSSLIELGPESSDDETEEMFYETSEVLDEILAIEESEAKRARKYLKNLEVDEEVFYDALESVEEKSCLKVEEVCSSKIKVKGSKVQNKRLKLRRSKICRDGMNVESSGIKIKKVEIEESEDLGLKLLMEETEVEDVKIYDKYSGVENVDTGRFKVEDENAEIKVSTTQSGSLNDEPLVCEETFIESGVDKSCEEGLKMKNYEGIKAEISNLNTETSKSDDITMDSTLEVQMGKDNVESKESLDVADVNVAEGASDFKDIEVRDGKTLNVKEKK